MGIAQLSVRSKKARDLAHKLSARENRPIHAIVEDALIQYAKRNPAQSTAAFVRRLQTLSVEGVELENLVAEHREPHLGIEL
jgi:hypothetical protein